jgi:quercetin dioxygenase-like cupin family protein
VKLWSDWRAAAGVAGDGPSVTYLHESAELKVVLVALGPGQALPPHPGPAACFHVLDGDGVMVVDGEERPVSAGATAIAPSGSVRSLRATAAGAGSGGTGGAGGMVFLGSLGDPAAENGPH